MKSVKYIDHTADTGFEITAKNMKQIFYISGKTLLKLVLKKIKIKAKETDKKIKLKADSFEELLHNFLNEILFLIFAKKFYIKNFSIKIFNEGKKQIVLDMKGYLLKDISTYILRELKSVTYHNLTINKSNKNYTARVIVDI